MAIASLASAADRPPILNIRSPLNDTVARPFVHVVAQCEDDDPRGCQEIKATAVSSFCGQIWSKAAFSAAPMSTAMDSR